MFLRAIVDEVGMKIEENIGRIYIPDLDPNGPNKGKNTMTAISSQIKQEIA